jgi:hypothetical protein
VGGNARTTLIYADECFIGSFRAGSVMASIFTAKLECAAMSLSVTRCTSSRIHYRSLFEELVQVPTILKRKEVA